jgi:predicted dehydrogenase
VKTGLVGYGYWGGGFVARNLARLSDLTVIVDQDLGRLAEAAAEWTQWGVRTSSEPGVAFTECDAVWIATPAVTHFDLISSALMNQCHVLAEKPVVMESQEAEMLCNLADRQDLALVGGFTSLHTEQHARSRRICSLNLAKPREVRVHRRTDRASKSDHSVLWGLGPHDVAAVIDLLGEPDGVRWWGNEHRMCGKFEYADSAEATFEFDWLAQQRSRSFAINGVETANEADRVEPLLAEVGDFVSLCLDRSDARRATARRLLQQVTDALAVLPLNVSEAVV